MAYHNENYKYGRLSFGGYLPLRVVILCQMTILTLCHFYPPMLAQKQKILVIHFQNLLASKISSLCNTMERELHEIWKM